MSWNQAERGTIERSATPESMRTMRLDQAVRSLFPRPRSSGLRMVDCSGLVVDDSPHAIADWFIGGTERISPSKVRGARLAPKLIYLGNFFVRMKSFQWKNPAISSTRGKRRVKLERRR